MALSIDTMVRVAHADIAMHMAFPRSLWHWQGSSDAIGSMDVVEGDGEPIRIKKDDGVVITGNCDRSISAPDGGMIHVDGDLTAEIQVAGHYEVVIAGNVTRGATIDAAGFCHVFVGGRFSGDFRSADSAKVWIGEDFDGTIHTGNPSTELAIEGDCTGSIAPSGAAALLLMSVGGFAANASMMKIADYGYVQFNASIGSSDVPRGIYPHDNYRRRTQQGNIFNRWSVTTEVGRST